MIRHHPRNLLIGLLALIATLAGGCQAPLTVGQKEERQRLAAFDYPAEAEYGPDLDLACERQQGTLRIANRTTRGYRDAQIWLNQQYVRVVGSIDIGPDNVYNLTRWVNHYEEPFPVGTLLAPDKAFPVVLAELYDPGTGLRHRLLVWPDDVTP